MNRGYWLLGRVGKYILTSKSSINYFIIIFSIKFMKIAYLPTLLFILLRVKN
ncbi:hypothetical protein E27107_200330 [Elizabethkingia anophelis]|nr:hypothetical protein E18064_360334 [Elizabethkingia anophelis]CDN77677.1 hypothetical protein E27107_200330 [Elizabethkingia anophelis]